MQPEVSFDIPNSLTEKGSSLWLKGTVKMSSNATNSSNSAKSSSSSDDMTAYMIMTLQHQGVNDSRPSAFCDIHVILVRTIASLQWLKIHLDKRATFYVRNNLHIYNSKEEVLNRAKSNDLSEEMLESMRNFNAEDDIFIELYNVTNDWDGMFYFVVELMNETKTVIKRYSSSKEVNVIGEHKTSIMYTSILQKIKL